MSTADNIRSNTDNRLFYLSDDVDNISIGKICFDLLYILDQDDKQEEKEIGFKREPIKIYINSYGGSVYDMWALIDIMLNSKTPIYTYCTGYAMSAAFKIFLAGSKRFATKHSTFMYHQMNCTRHGKYQDLVEDRDEMDWLNKTIEEYVVDRTKITQKFIDDVRIKKQDVYFHINSALEYGIVDEVM